MTIEHIMMDLFLKSLHIIFIKFPKLFKTSTNENNTYNYVSMLSNSDNPWILGTYVSIANH